MPQMHLDIPLTQLQVALGGAVACWQTVKIVPAVEQLTVYAMRDSHPRYQNRTRENDIDEVEDQQCAAYGYDRATP
eukprot:CAMPEP_0115879492 /NCGR_PEP_ID=MMETSP0287-20121206/27348_1 /TAXON_ID=412157 /ORGANISM="Chrysochromulina rotalis, Strain UIO044" /LENGTH=75 /DNA_ID=CAMNT_0003335203 /DNA_START=50 /DNA_END=274 /DNA_ORIENTATION=+